jgi:hypothetical protein
MISALIDPDFGQITVSEREVGILPKKLLLVFAN